MMLKYKSSMQPQPQLPKVSTRLGLVLLEYRLSSARACLAIYSTRL